MRRIDARAVLAARDTDEFNRFVEDYQGFIFNTACKAAKRFLTKDDEEWSVALEAFCGAVMRYSFEKGAFIAFAELLIRRRLIDFYRAERKRSVELPVSPLLFAGEAESSAEQPRLAAELAKITAGGTDFTLKDEIQAANGVFSHYGFSFYELAACSPKAKKTRASCRAAILALLASPSMLAQLRRTGMLPLKELETSSRVPRKILERHRNYLIAAVEILSGDYPGLAAYLHPMGEDVT